MGAIVYKSYEFSDETPNGIMMGTARAVTVDGIKDLADKLSVSQDRLGVLQKTEESLLFLQKRPYFSSFLKNLDADEKVNAYSMINIGQGERIFPLEKPDEKKAESIRKLLKLLSPVEEFYSSIGGIVGYQAAVLSLISTLDIKTEDAVDYRRPAGFDIREPDPVVRGYIRQTIENAEALAEVYPVGGAGDRLNLLDEASGEPLPAACLVFLGHTLLESLIRDLEAREYLTYKLTGKRVVTPVAMMTSFEKQNHRLIMDNLARKNWFGRPKDSIYLFIQPQVPVVDGQGNWLFKAPFEPIVKPGGHGAIWTQAIRDGILNALKAKGVSKMLIKQINNPVAGTDSGILGFLGVGLKENKTFGFASCERVVNANEGMDVVAERRNGSSWGYSITNVEYTEFKRKGIQDAPVEEGGHYSLFPCNTNILFADIAGIESVHPLCPIPGITLNMKTTFKAIGNAGEPLEVKGGRLESTMQNIADAIVDWVPEKLKEGEEKTELRSYLTYNDRRKTLSVTKKAWDGSGSCLETPEGCLYDMMLNAEDLLKNHCSFKVPSQPQISEYQQRGLSFVFSYHPALGPIYEVIGQKIREGTLEEGAELIVEAADVDIERLHLKGSFEIKAESPVGCLDGEGHLSLGSFESSCCLKNVKIVNRGLGGSIAPGYWKGPERHEVCSIILEEGAEIFAEDITIEGPFEVRVPKGMRAQLVHESGSLQIVFEKRSRSSHWHYAFGEEDRIVLSNNSEDNS